jgi:predicted ABC-type ATPase
MKKRLRIFAGPNGSGKSTLFEKFSKNYNAGIFINADQIENILDKKKLIDLNNYNLKSNQQELEDFLQKTSSISLIEKAEKTGYKINLVIRENIIVNLSNESHSYAGSLIASFLREKILQSNKSFSFETVMSHTSKLEEIKEAKNLGYTTYLYFVCIDDPEVNISRVENRVQKGGHNVSKEKVRERYSRTLNNLFPAIELCDRVYLFDNTGEELTLIASIMGGEALELQVDEKLFPNWFAKYVLNHFIR